MAINIEVTAVGGASKWIRGIVSHDMGRIQKAVDDGESLTMTCADGGSANVDFSRAFMVRFQEAGSGHKRR